MKLKLTFLAIIVSAIMHSAGRRLAAKLLIRDEARRIAANVAKLPVLRRQAEAIIRKRDARSTLAYV
jgi:hypothetical protein